MTKVGPYEVVRELGRGGMGVVLEVRQPDLPRRLALKLISRDVASPEALERFAREARLLARVRHPHVVTVHAFERTEDGRPYLVTDLVEGTNLKQLARTAPFEPARAARIVGTLASAVSALHAEGILHRDLKPENVILRGDDSPVLLDFGLAREHDAQRLTQTGALVGTPAYMSPEQAGGDVHALDARSDVYGLGAILFELLAGRPPFEGAPIQVVNAVLMKDPVWPTKQRADIPPTLEAVLERAMAKQPAERHASATALAEDLASVARGEPPTTAPRASRAGAWLAAIVALAVVVGVALTLRSSPPPAPPATPTPVTSEVPVPVSPKVSEPTWNEDEQVRSYREHQTWLGGDGAGHPGRAAVEDRLALWRSRERPLLQTTLWSTDSLPGSFVLRWASNTHVVCLDASKTAFVLDVERGREVEPIWGIVEAHFLRDVAAIAREGQDLQLLFCHDRRLFKTESIPDVGVRLEHPVLEEVATDPEQSFRAIAVSPDGARAVLAGSFGYAVELDLSVEPWTRRRFEPLTIRVNEITYSADGTRVVFGADGTTMVDRTVSLWNEEGVELAVDRPHGTVRSLAAGPDGLLVVGTTVGPASLRWGLPMDALGLKQLPVDATIPYVAVSAASGRTRLYGVTQPSPLGGGVQLIVWDVGDGGAVKELRRVSLGDPPVVSIAVSPDGAVLAVVREVTPKVAACVELWAAGDP